MKELPDIATIGDELCGFLRSAILDENVELDRTSRLSVLGVDSVSLVELVLFIERRFKVTLPESALTRENLECVETLARCISVFTPEDQP
ncbi:MAG: acyl carrier protein [Phycisphaerae bacterium]